MFVVPSLFQSLLCTLWIKYLWLRYWPPEITMIQLKMQWVKNASRYENTTWMYTKSFVVENGYSQHLCNSKIGVNGVNYRRQNFKSIVWCTRILATNFFFFSFKVVATWTTEKKVGQNIESTCRALSFVIAGFNTDSLQLSALEAVNSTPLKLWRRKPRVKQHTCRLARSHEPHSWRNCGR